MEQGTVLYIVKLGKLFCLSKALLPMGQLLIWLLVPTVAAHNTNTCRCMRWIWTAAQTERLSPDANLSGWGYLGDKVGCGGVTWLLLCDGHAYQKSYTVCWRVVGFLSWVSGYLSFSRPLCLNTSILPQKSSSSDNDFFFRVQCALKSCCVWSSLN